MKKIVKNVTSLFSTNASPKTKFNLDKVLKLERLDMAIMEIDSYLNKKSEYGEKIEKLNESQKTLLIIENLEREINNGGGVLNWCFYKLIKIMN